ncbi:WD40 repeat domain-containing protein [Flindersiella endophytica]
MTNRRALGGLAAVLLLATVLVPVLVDRVEHMSTRDPAAARPTASMVSVLRLPTAAPPTGRRSVPTPTATASRPPRAKLGPRGTGAAGEIRFPRTAPPLPDRGVPPGVLAYSTSCADATKPCWSWRLLDWKGKHWTLQSATAVSLSPNGRRLVYFQPDGRFVVRDLSSGAVDQPVLVPRQALDQLDPHVTWSPNGRWLTIDYQAVLTSGAHRRAILVDTTRMRARTLGIDCCVAGLQPTGDWLLTYDLYGSQPNVFQLEDVATGRTVRTIDPEELYGQRWAKGRTGYPLSPDGKQFAIFLWDREAGTHGLGLVDTATGEVAGRHELRAEGVAWGDLIGWPDVRTVAVTTEGGGQVLTYDVQTRKLRAAYTFATPPDRLTVAVSLVRAQ